MIGSMLKKVIVLLWRDSLVQLLPREQTNWLPKGKSKSRKRGRQLSSTRNFLRKSELSVRAKTSETLGEKRKRSREARPRLLKSWLPKKKLRRKRTRKSRLLKSQEKQSSALMF